MRPRARSLSATMARRGGRAGPRAVGVVAGEGENEVRHFAGFLEVVQFTEELVGTDWSVMLVYLGVAGVDQVSAARGRRCARRRCLPFAFLVGFPVFGPRESSSFSSMSTRFGWLGSQRAGRQNSP